MKFKEAKKCANCGAQYVAKDLIPDSIRPWVIGGHIVGYVFECKCNGSMLVKDADENESKPKTLAK